MVIFRWLFLFLIYRSHSITKTIQVRRTRHAGHCWRSRDELISDVLLWTPSYGRVKAGWPARTYIQQLCEDTGCSPEDLPEVMNDREKWWERVRDIRASGMTWWWWYLYIIIIIILCCLHGFLSLSLAIFYHYLLSLLAGLLDNILCLYRAVVENFLLVGPHWYVSVWRGSEKNITHEFVLTSPAVFQMFCSSYLDDFRD